MRVQKLISEKAIQKKIKKLAVQILRDYNGKEIIIIGILKGSWIFMADLVRKLEGMKIKCDFLEASSYGLKKITQGKVKISSLTNKFIKNKDVLLIEDIVDTGITLNKIKKYLEAFKPHSLKICVLLDKSLRRKVNISIDYIGFTVSDKFVVGYGLDYAEQFRNLSYIGEIED